MLFLTWNQESCPKHWLSCGCGGWEPLLQWFLESFRPPALSPYFRSFGQVALSLSSGRWPSVSPLCVKFVVVARSPRPGSHAAERRGVRIPVENEGDRASAVYYMLYLIASTFIWNAEFICLASVFDQIKIASFETLANFIRALSRQAIPLYE